jgi:hypothetical protein
MRVKHRVKPMQSWGSLDSQLIEDWKERRCDLIFTFQRMSKKPVSNCTLSEYSTLRPGMQIGSLPLIAVMAASTTRNIPNPSIAKLALFNYLLPSLMRTLDCGYRYEYVLGYDQGDAFYDSSQVTYCAHCAHCLTNYAGSHAHNPYTT